MATKFKIKIMLKIVKPHRDWTLKQWQNTHDVMSTDFCSRVMMMMGIFGVRRAVDEVIGPSCLVANVQVCGGRAMTWSCFSWPGLESTTKSAQKRLHKPTTWISWMIMIFHLHFFSFLVVQAYSKKTKSDFLHDSGSMRHHFHTWIGHSRVQT